MPKAFWAGFNKKADALTGGGGHTGAGKGNLGTSEEYPERQGPVNAGDSAPQTDKTLLDRERNPRDYNIYELGPELRDESNPHIRY
jgi:hypothetical protein